MPEWIKTPYRKTPDGSRAGDRTWFAIGDIHGRHNLMRQMLETVGQLGKNETFGLVLTGDLIDRGPCSLRCLELAEEAGNITGAAETVILPGNHELMLLDFLFGRDELYIWMNNGGLTLMSEIEGALEAASNGMRKGQDYRDLRNIIMPALPKYWTEENFPYFYRSRDIIFVHAGIHPRTDIAEFLSRSHQYARLQELRNGRHWAWIREEFTHHRGPWPSEEKVCVVHGHSPVTRMMFSDARELEYLALFPNGCQRICLDGGAASVEQGIICEFREDMVRLHCIQLA
ncbi:MAG: metallophosphoesterase [Roseovarius sp.]|nr:metallophosphoesterase [Roseovarius sp.]